MGWMGYSFIEAALCCILLNLSSTFARDDIDDTVSMSCSSNHGCLMSVIGLHLGDRGVEGNVPLNFIRNAQPEV
jgi:hypothetical protein